ncbi:exodeoxyribonuclease VII small subunit [Candidatus Saccharibacteria bacterium]|nr:exodeoxyribonuclease VII small subunit [Candidatus Saccharibacteria bacterium]MBR0424375.1 exodeoxyribonuclease VII small subunit [Candidatus Saccharibacteria bacterium]
MKGESMTDKKMAGKNLNQKIKELDEKVAWFSSDDFELEKAVKEYEETLVLTREIEEDLKNLKNEIEVLDKDFSKDVI